MRLRTFIRMDGGVSWKLMKLIILVLCIYTVSAARKGARPHYRTAYACEGTVLDIACEPGHTIQLIRANYGRFSISICNMNGNLRLSVNCMSHRSFRVMQERCGQKNSCSISASDEVFNDPCPGTHKYLEAHFQCVPETPLSSTTKAPRRPAVFSPPNFWPTKSTTKSTTTTTTTKSTTTTVKTTTAATTTTTTTPVPEMEKSSPEEPAPEKVNVVVEDDVTDKPELSKDKYSGKDSDDSEPKIVEIIPSTVKPDQVYLTKPSSTEKTVLEYCTPTMKRGLFWNWTVSGDTFSQACPQKWATGIAIWKCEGHPPRFVPKTPDLSECNSPSIERIENRMSSHESVVKIAQELAEVTSTDSLYGGDMKSVTRIVKRMISTMEHRLRRLQDDRQKQTAVKLLTESVVAIVSNILDSRQVDAWNDLPRYEQVKSARSLLISLEENAFLLADTMNEEELYRQAGNNMLMSVRVIETRHVSDAMFPAPEEIVGTAWEKMEDTIYIPRESILDYVRKGLVKMVFISYNNIEWLLNPNQVRGRSRTRSYNNETQVVNSKVMTASLTHNRRIPLRQPVVLTLRNIHAQNVTNPTCVFWDFEMNVWSDRGCYLKSANLTHTVCSCSHLTNFAVLMDVRASEISSEHQVALQVITYVGCIISIVCLLLTLITFQCLKGLKNDRTTIHKNLCLCLLIAEALFLGGISQTEVRILCGVIAGFLQYFFLAAFAWMFMEGFQLYVMLVEVFESEKSRIRWYYLVAYGVPMIIVSISAIIDPFSYGTARYCWLRADNYFIFSFVGPVIVVIFANIIFLSIAVGIMCRHTNVTTSMKNKEHSKLNSASGEEEFKDSKPTIVVWIRGALVLVFLLGLTWTFGLLYLSQETLIMAYMFTIINSLQGVFIFLFHCVKNEKVQKEYKKFIRRAQWLPECMKPSKTYERRSSLYINSNGTGSPPPSTGQQSYLFRLWNSPKGKDRSLSTGNTSVLKSTTPGRPSTCIPKQEPERFTHEGSDRDSGHGGSFQEDSPDVVNSSRQAYHLQNGLTNNLSVLDCSIVDSDFVTEYCAQNTPGNNELKDNETKCQQQRDSVTGHIYESIDEDAALDKNISPKFISYDISDEELMMKYTSDISRQSSTTSSGRPLIGHNNSLLRHKLCNIVLPPSGPRAPPPPPPRDNFPSLFDIIPSDMDSKQDTYGSMPNIQQNYCCDHSQLPNVVHQHSSSTPVDSTQRYQCGDNIVLDMGDGRRMVFNPNTNIALCHHDVHRNKFSTEC